MNEKELLQQGRSKIEDPEHWCTGTLAINAEGEPVDPDARDAYAFCAVGAIFSGYDLDPIYQRARDLLDSCAIEMGYEPDGEGPYAIVDLNDNSDHATVLAAYDCAIRKADG